MFQSLKRTRSRTRLSSWKSLAGRREEAEGRKGGEKREEAEGRKGEKGEVAEGRKGGERRESAGVREEEWKGKRLGWRRKKRRDGKSFFFFNLFR